MEHYFLKRAKINFTLCVFVTSIFFWFQSFASLVLQKTMQDHVRNEIRKKDTSDCKKVPGDG